MSKPSTIAVSVACSLVTVRYFYSSPGLSTYICATIFALLLTVLGAVFHARFIYAFYTSPLIDLPLIKRNTWKECVDLLDPPTYLYAFDHIPNDGLLRRLDTLNQEVIVLTSPKIAAECLQLRADDFEKLPAIRRALRDMLGDGLVSSEGHDHKIQRKAVAPAFNARTIKDLYPFFWSKAQQTVSLIQNDVLSQTDKGTPATIDMEDWAARLSLDMISEAGFGSSFDALEQPFNALNRWYRAAFVVDENTRGLFVLTFMTHPMVTNSLPLQKVKEKLEGIRGVRKWIGELIEKRKMEMDENADDLEYFDKSGKKDIVSTIMKAGTLGTQGLVEQSLTFLGAGHETSATALTWIIHELSQPEHKHYQSALRKEIRAHLASPKEGVPMTSDLIESLPLLNAITQESLRLHAPALVIGRVAIRDTVLGGRLIPKGTCVRISLWAMGRSKKLWGDDAEVFRPERWLDLKSASSNTTTAEKITVEAQKARDDSFLHNITFGHGPHGCIGKSFALAENKSILAALIGSFEFAQVGGGHVEPRSVYGITGKIMGLKVETRIVEGW